jgi:hypothetical protein
MTIDMSDVAAFLDRVEEGDPATVLELRALLARRGRAGFERAVMVVAHKLGPHQSERARKLFGALVDYDVANPPVAENRATRRARKAIER